MRNLARVIGSIVPECDDTSEQGTCDQVDWRHPSRACQIDRKKEVHRCVGSLVPMFMWIALLARG
jgi:hypothetical protein